MFFFGVNALRQPAIPDRAVHPSKQALMAFASTFPFYLDDERERGMLKGKDEHTTAPLLVRLCQTLTCRVEPWMRCGVAFPL